MKRMLQTRDARAAAEASGVRSSHGSAASPAGWRRWARLALLYWRRAADLFPWTPLGVLLTGLAYAALELLARAELDLVWLVVGYVGLGLTLITPLLVLLAAGWLKLRGPLPEVRASASNPLVLETGVPVESGFKLPLPWYVPLVQLRWEWMFPTGATIDSRREGGVLCERVQLADRGRFELIERRVTLMDPFGLSRVVLRMSQARPVDVLPRLAGLSRLPALSSLASGDAAPHPMGLEDGDRLELRRYMPGDPARFIHWKVLARARRLMVRTPERALSVARRTAAFLIAAPNDDASAAVARLALERRMLGNEWVFATDVDVAGSERMDAALDALMRSIAARERGGEGLAAFFERVEREGPASLLVFAPSRPGAWLAHVAAAARRRKLRVIIGVDGVHARARPPLLVRLLAFHEPTEGALAVELEEVQRTLAQAGAQVTVLDRGTGRALSAAHQQALARPRHASREVA
jgi:uncharacterized protein (DUF58 family)